MQLSLIEYGERLKKEAIDRVEMASTPWVEIALACIRKISKEKEFFTSDDIWEGLVRRGINCKPSDPRAMGAALRAAATIGLCERTDRTKKSIRPECHRRPLTIWRGLL